jgi:hypothetical protein
MATAILAGAGVADLVGAIQIGVGVIQYMDTTIITLTIQAEEVLLMLMELTEVDILKTKS